MPYNFSDSRLETEALILGYAMSRLDRGYLNARRVSTWNQAYSEASNRLGPPAASFKNLRDEFDPYCSSSRRGWHGRDIRPNRQRVLEELHQISDDSLLELVSRILDRDTASIAEAIDLLIYPIRTVNNVAERLRTGRLAEEYFLKNSSLIIGIPNRIIDCRLSAQGYDFQISEHPAVIEVKGLKKLSGTLAFTDREWREARTRGDDYIVVIVGNLEGQPRHSLVSNPRSNLQAACKYESRLTATWIAGFRL